MFPFQRILKCDQGLHVDYLEVLAEIAPLLTKERLQKIEQVVPHRDFGAAIVLENIYDRGNASAVMRSAEAMGFVNFHLIQTGEKFKEAKRTTAGADKWLEVQKWKSTKACVDRLKSEGKKIYVTHLDSSAKPLEQVDLTAPCALVLGNEHEGCSAEMLAAADQKVILPMVGFVQSYNISVAGALAIQTLFQHRRSRTNSQLTADEMEILKAVYCLRTQDSAEATLKELQRRKNL